MEEKTPTDSANKAYPYIRTMAQDLARAKGKAPATKKEEQKSAVSKGGPPSGLPIVEKSQLENKAKSETTALPKDFSGSQRPEKKILPKPPQPSEKDKKNKKVFPVLILVSLAAVIIIGGLGGFFYWYNYINQPSPPVEPTITHFECLDNQCMEIEGSGINECALDQDCQPSVVEPEALFLVDSVQTIELADSADSLTTQVKNLIREQGQNQGNLNQILVKSEKGDYLDLDSLLTRLNLDFPDSVMGLVATSSDSYYTFFSYAQEPETRLGIALKMQTPEDVPAILQDWEPQMSDDLMPLLMQEQAPSAFGEGFLDNAYQEIDIRYLNFPTSDLSIDYAQIGSRLIITTSKQSMFEVIERIQASE